MYYIEQSMLVTGIVYVLFSCIIPFSSGIYLLDLNAKKSMFMTVLFNGFVVLMNYGISYALDMLDQYITII